eukprot:468291-Prymnesium_polylepis.1
MRAKPPPRRLARVSWQLQGRSQAPQCWIAGSNLVSSPPTTHAQPTGARTDAAPRARCANRRTPRAPHTTRAAHQHAHTAHSQITKWPRPCSSSASSLRRM